jgi:hypothetical protein
VKAIKSFEQGLLGLVQPRLAAPMRMGYCGSKSRFRMKNQALLMAFLLAIASAALAETRTFVLKSGATVQGEVVSIGLDAVQIKKSSDGKVYSLSLAYLSDSNRLDLVAERARRWQPIEVIRLEGSASAGRYKQCEVRGTNVSNVILIEMLPPAVEAILNNRNQQAVQIAQLSDAIENRDWAVQRADAATPNTATGDPDYVNSVMVQRARVNVAIVDLNQAKANLAKLQDSYSDYLDNTRAETILQMKNTGFVYQGLQVWQCFDPRRPQ